MIGSVCETVECKISFLLHYKLRVHKSFKAAKCARLLIAIIIAFSTKKSLLCLKFINVQLHRFRSITKQFFRKADGVVVLYDVTVAESFKAVKPWLVNVQVLLTFELLRTRCRVGEIKSLLPS